MLIACVVATQSPDPSTQNGAVIYNPVNGAIVATAFNEFPSGVRYLEERWLRPTKYSYVEHAERNAIYQAARAGVATEGLTMVAPWASCADCARAIVQAGITTLARLPAPHSPQWEDSIAHAEAIFEEGGVEVITLTSDFPTAPPLLRHGVVWHPDAHSEKSEE